jgi:hypothetical protein
MGQAEQLHAFGGHPPPGRTRAEGEGDKVREYWMNNEIDDFISRMKEGDTSSFDMDAKGRAVHILAEAIQHIRHEGLTKVDVAKSLSYAASVLVGREANWK